MQIFRNLQGGRMNKGTTSDYMMEDITPAG